MTALEKELIHEQFRGVIAMISASNDLQSEKDKNQQAQLDRIECQTTKTNGRVTKLEEWKWKHVGIGIAISSIFGGGITLLTLYLMI